MDSCGYQRRAFPKQLQAALKRKWCNRPCLALIDSEVFSYLSDKFPAAVGEELVVVWRSPCAEHQYPWVARNLKLPNGLGRLVDVRQAIADVLNQIGKGDDVLEAFVAGQFHPVNSHSDLRDVEEEANTGKPSCTVAKDQGTKSNHYRGRCGACSGCLANGQK
jgi:hypothetical protein